MTSPARAQLVTELLFQRESQRSDLLNENVTDTLLIQMLISLADLYKPKDGEKILVTSVYSDHSPDGDLGPHGHHPDSGPGFAVDVAPSLDGWVGLMLAIAACPYVWTAGLGGPAAKAGESVVHWPKDGKFVLFMDNDSPHIHLQSANGSGSGLRTS
jgi:hypothetical protein